MHLIHHLYLYINNRPKLKNALKKVLVKFPLLLSFLVKRANTIKNSNTKLSFEDLSIRGRSIYNEICLELDKTKIGNK